MAGIQDIRFTKLVSSAILLKEEMYCVCKMDYSGLRFMFPLQNAIWQFALEPSSENVGQQQLSEK